MEEYNDNQTFNEFENPQPERPTGLTFACILSFINAGWQVISNFFTFMMYNTMRGMFENESYQEMLESLDQDTELMNQSMAMMFSVSRVYYLLIAVLFVASFVGVYQMWHLQKKGFHIYTIAQLLILIVSALMAPDSGILMSVVFTVLWIGLYSIYYKKRLQ